MEKNANFFGDETRQTWCQLAQKLVRIQKYWDQLEKPSELAEKWPRSSWPKLAICHRVPPSSAIRCEKSSIPVCRLRPHGGPAHASLWWPEHGGLVMVVGKEGRKRERRESKDREGTGGKRGSWGEKRRGPELGHMSSSDWPTLLSSFFLKLPVLPPYFL